MAITIPITGEITRKEFEIIRKAHQIELRECLKKMTDDARCELLRNIADSEDIALRTVKETLNQE